MDFGEQLQKVNARLRAANTRVVVDVRGESLYLRATLPPRPGSKKTEPHQQRVALGMPANLAALREAEKEAKLMSALLATKEFEWSRYRVESPNRETCEAWIERLKEHYLNTGGKLSTWNGDYNKAFKKLPLTKRLDDEVLKQLVLSSKPNSKTRLRICMAVGVLAKFANLSFDPSPFKGNYGPASVKRRDLPSDEMIALQRNAITNPAWRWVYGVMATYGLRNHEVFKLDLADFPIIRVAKDTKTGEREVWPCYPEWAEQWQLNERLLPNVDLDRDNEAIGHSVTEYLGEKLPFAPYDLRHAWAIRTMEFGWPDALAAQQMGHGLGVHNRTYHRWITKRHHQKVYDLLVQRKDRPRPPTLANEAQT